MSLPCRPQTHDEPEAVLRQATLVGVKNDGGIEQSSRFDGVLHRKAGPDQLLLTMGKRVSATRIEEVDDIIEMAFEDPLNILMLLIKIADDLIEKLLDLFFTQ